MAFSSIFVTPLARQTAVQELTAFHLSQVGLALESVRQGTVMTVRAELPDNVDNRNGLRGWLAADGDGFCLDTNFHGRIPIRDGVFDFSGLLDRFPISDEKREKFSRQPVSLYDLDQCRFAMTEPLREKDADGNERFLLFRHVHDLAGQRGALAYAMETMANGIASAGLSVFKTEERLEEEMRAMGLSFQDLPEMIRGVWQSAFMKPNSAAGTEESVTPLMPFAASPASSISVARKGGDFSVAVVKVPVGQVLTAQGTDHYGYYWKEILDPQRHLFLQHPDAYETEFTSTRPFILREYIAKIYTEGAIITP